MSPRPTDPTATDPTATDPTATDPTATDPTATDRSAATVPDGPEVQTSQLAAGNAPEAGHPLGLSVPQIAGGALAAVTAAVAASYFGVGGTLTGAAFGSVVSTVAASLYSTSLTRAARAGAAGVSKVLVVRPAGSGTGPLEASAQDPAAVPPVVPREPVHPDAAPAAGWWTRVRWRPVALVAGLVFVVAMAVVSVSELALGHPLGNSGAAGTTLSNLGGGSAPSGGTPATSPAATPSPSSSDVGSPTPSASASPTDAASPTGSPAPSPGATPVPTAGTGTGSGTSTTAPNTTAPPTTPGG